jgi:hypothetical protein
LPYGASLVEEEGAFNAESSIVGRCEATTSATSRNHKKGSTRHIKVESHFAVMSHIA